jgi:hypothetical protein
MFLKNFRERILRLATPVSITLTLLASTLLFCDYHLRWKNEKWKHAIHSDGEKSYRYLTIVFIDRNLDASQNETGSPIKPFIGTSLFFLPFFAAAYFLSLIFQLPLDGHSIMFQVLITIGTLFYLITGLYYLSRFLKLYKIPDWIICTVLVAVVFSTSIFYYTVRAPGWSHIVTFTLVSFLLYHSRKIYFGYDSRDVLLIIVAFSLLFWTRPTDSIIIFTAPFLAGGWKNFIATLRQFVENRKLVLTAVALATIPMICQLLMYKLQTGNFIIWSYGKGERFDFLNPKLEEVLFGYAKGLFPYTPVCLLSSIGFISLFKRSKSQFFCFLIYMAVNAYIISSWWSWNYGLTFGARAFIASLPVFIFLLALLLTDSKLLLRAVVVAFIVLFAVMNFIRMYQAEKGILDLDFRTTRQSYWKTLLAPDGNYTGKNHRLPVDTSSENLIGITTFHQSTGAYYSENGCSEIAATTSPHSESLNVDFTKVPYNRNVLIRATGLFFSAGEKNNARFVMDISHNGKSFTYEFFPVNRYLDNYNLWQQLVFEFYLPKLKPEFEHSGENKMHFYLFNDSGINCCMDNIKVEFIELKKLDRILDIQWQ